ncbi:MAG: alpha/beta hydrolase [Dehalococcoidia bacterium]|nr:alpha/beta hydrolase [Dehalococcoidia bacterium]
MTSTTTGLDIAAHLDDEHRPLFERIPARDLDADDIPGTVAVLRAAGAARQAQAQVVMPSTVTIEDHVAPGGEGQPDVPVRLYRPQSAPASAPAFYWIHGGGMVGGSVEASDAYCAWIADELGVLVASVDYRLAPEHPYPAPLDDCHAGLRWLVESADTLGVDRSRIALGGGSAGAGLAAGLALLVRDRGQIALCYQHLVYPMLDDRNETASSHAILDSRVWNRTCNAVGWNAYLGGRAGAPDVEAYAAPARATDLSGLPPTYICIGTLDLFLDEDIAYARALLAAGVPTELHVYPGAFHGSTGSVPNSALSRRWRADELASIRRALLG